MAVEGPRHIEDFGFKFEVLFYSGSCINMMIAGINPAGGLEWRISLGLGM